MVKANELRIGNWVFCLEPVLIESIDERGINRTNDSQMGSTQIRSYYCALDMLAGIPLTPEILEKCGFEKSTSNDIYEREIYSIQVANNTSLYFDAHKNWMRGDADVEWYLSHEWNNNHFKNDFWGNPKYLHQLQNLYFALAGEELIVNLHDETIHVQGTEPGDKILEGKE
jgi:hypothetical protein